MYASDYINAMLRIALKKKTRAALHKCSMLRIALKKGKLAQHYINAYASHRIKYELLNEIFDRLELQPVIHRLHWYESITI